jgi:hypothetical protein
VFDREPVPIFNRLVAQDPQRHALERFNKHLLEGDEVGVLLEQPQPPIGPMEHMVRVTAHDGPIPAAA